MSAILIFKLLVASANLGAIAYFGACLALYWGQRRLIFFPKPVLTATPSDFDLSYEDRWIAVSDPDGKIGQIHSWWIPAAIESDRVLLFFHGNGCNISDNLSAVKRFYEMGFSVLSVDYRSYGRSPGAFPSEASVYRDAQAAWDDLVEQHQVLPSNLYLYGHSLGGAIAIDLAVRRPQSAGIVVENTFTSLKAMVDYQKRFRWLPVNLILDQHFDSLAKLALLQIPLLVIHGTHDRTVPIQMGRRIYESAPVPKQYLIVPDAGHHNAGAVAGSHYLEAIANFVAFAQPSRPAVLR